MVYGVPYKMFKMPTKLVRYGHYQLFVHTYVAYRKNEILQFDLPLSSTQILSVANVSGQPLEVDHEQPYLESQSSNIES